MSWLVYWHWLALALLLIIAETLGAAGFLVALGMAAVLTGMLTWIFDLTWQWQLLWFSGLCILSAVLWWLLLANRSVQNTPTFINRPLESMIGRITYLSDAIVNGRGKIYVNDAYWFVTGPELSKGARVKVVAVQDNILVVEADESL